MLKDVSQLDVYSQVVTPLLPHFLNGYNCTIFTYGQTGSGKTYTMFGPQIANRQRREEQKQTIVHRNRFASENENAIMQQIKLKQSGQERKEHPELDPHVRNYLEQVV